MTELNDDILARLCAYADGELDATERAELDALIAADPQMRRALDEMQSTVAALGQLGGERAPDDFDARVARRIRRRSRGRFFAEHHGRWQGQLTLAFVVIAVLTLMAIAMLAEPGRIEILWDDSSPSPAQDPDPAPADDAAQAPAPSGASTADAAAPSPATASPGRTFADMTTTWAPMRREGSAWAVVQAGDDAHAALVARFGADRVVELAPGHWEVRVPVADEAEAVAGLDTLGPMRRRVVTLDERATETTITVFAAEPDSGTLFAEP